jgi:FkbM family methyltransferase
MKVLKKVKTGVTRIIQGQFNLIPYHPFSWLPITIEPYEMIFKAMAHNGKTWFIPVNSKEFALWAFRFLEANERFLKILKEGDILAEIGACTGEYTIPAAQKIGKKGKVFAFEADFLGCECIKKNAQVHRLTNIEVFNEALSDTIGQKVSLSIPTNLSGGMILKARNGSLVTKTLDGCLKNIPIDVLKITVNGHELEVLAGAQMLLSQVRAIVLQSAWHEELKKFLEDFGYSVKESINAQDSPEGVKIMLFERKIY